MVQSGTVIHGLFPQLIGISWVSGGIITPFYIGEYSFSIQDLLEPIAILPNGNISIPPLLAASNYGQELFRRNEGQSIKMVG